MKNMQLNLNFSNSILIWTLSIIWLWNYLISIYRFQLPLYIFWISLVSLSFLIVWQIGKIKNGLQESIVLLEIVILCFILRLIFVLTVPYGAFGRDVHFDYYVTKILFKYGWPLPSDLNILPGTRIVSQWPSIHILGGIISEISAIKLFAVEGDVFTVVKWIPTIVSSCRILLVYVFTKKICKNIKIALLATFGSGILFYDLMFHSWFVRETIGLAMFFLFLYFYIVYLVERKKSVSILSILTTFTLLLSHHLTYFALLVFLTILLVYTYFYNIVKNFFKLHRSPVELNLGNISILVLVFTFFIIYLIYIGNPVFKILVISFKSLFEPSYGVPIFITSHRVLLRDKMIFYLRFLFTGIFLMLMAANIYKNRRGDIFWDLFYLVMAITSFSIIIILTASRSYPLNIRYYRLEPFIWPFILISVARSIFNLKYRNLKYIITLFVIFNVFQVPPYVYNSNSEPPYLSNEVSMRYNLSDYIGIEWFSSDGKVVGDSTILELLGGLKQIHVITDIGVYRGDISRIRNYEWFVIRTEDFKLVKSTLGSTTHLTINSYRRYILSENILKCYDNENIEFYRVIR